jgi:hypothetical protein
MNKYRELFIEKLAIKQPNVQLIGDYKSSQDKVDVSFEGHIYCIRPNDLLNGIKPSVSSLKDKTSYFINRSNKVHNFRYDYTESIYLTTEKKVIITCEFHGNFLQTPHHHLNGMGCLECARENSVQGFDWYKDKENWGKPSCCYLLYIYSETEAFWKIGVSRNIKGRIRDLKRQGDYEVIIQDILYSTAYECYFNFEQPKLKNIKKLGLSYNPSIKFDGSTECFIGIDNNFKLTQEL